MQELGTLKRVDPRSVWEHEAQDFTPWLRENIELLAETVGLELDLVETESPVGEFAVDLYAKDLNTGRWVIIENQLAQTDHAHLGQLMTYGAGKEAGVVIWISPKFRDEHREALNWLNEITDESVSFFGIELEVLQIGKSLLAPNLRLVVQPSEWRKIVSPSALSPRQRAYLAFFTGWLDKVKAEHPYLTTATKAEPQNWFRFPGGRSGFSMGAAFGRGGIFRVDLIISTGNKVKNKAAFDALYDDRKEIEHDIGQPLVWERLDDIQASSIHCGRDGRITDDATHLEELRDWAVELVSTFRKVFEPRVRELTL